MVSSHNQNHTSETQVICLAFNSSCFQLFGNTRFFLNYCIPKPFVLWISAHRHCLSYLVTSRVLTSTTTLTMNKTRDTLAEEGKVTVICI